jgi:hypothetical protein
VKPRRLAAALGLAYLVALPSMALAAPSSQPDLGFPVVNGSVAAITVIKGAVAVCVEHVVGYPPRA